MSIEAANSQYNTAFRRYRHTFERGLDSNQMDRLTAMQSYDSQAREILMDIIIDIKKSNNNHITSTRQSMA